MSAKRKKKPSFEMPEELQSAPQTGWVYRSDAAAEPQPAIPELKHAAAEPAEPSTVQPWAEADGHSAPRLSLPRPAQEPADTNHNHKPKPQDPGIVDLTWKTLESGFATVNNCAKLGYRIATAPWRIGTWVITGGWWK